MTRVRRLARALGSLWLALGAVLLLMPSEWIPADLADNDGIAHAAVFFVAVALWAVALPGRAIWVLVVALVLAAGSELAQATFTPNRSAGWTDVAANLVGIGIGMAVGVSASKLIEHRASSRRLGSDEIARASGPR